MSTGQTHAGTDHPGGTLQPTVGPKDHAQGDSEAVVTVVEYGDYECPSCGRAYPVVKEVQRTLGSRLRFVFRNFPLGEMHPHAVHAAEAAESVAEHGGENAFWAMHDALYEHQQDADDALDDDHLVRYATDAGVDAAAVVRDLEGDRMEQRVREDFMSGVRSGVNGTPTFFINGVRYDGDWMHADRFVSAIEQAIPGA